MAKKNLAVSQVTQSSGFLAKHRNIGVKIPIFPDSISEIAAFSNMALTFVVPLGIRKTVSRAPSMR